MTVLIHSQALYMHFWLFLCCVCQKQAKESFFSSLFCGIYVPYFCCFAVRMYHCVNVIFIYVCVFFWEILLTIVIIIMEIIIIIQDNSHNRAEIWREKYNVYRNSWMMMIMWVEQPKNQRIKNICVRFHFG